MRGTAARDLFTKTVDNTVEKDLRNVARHRARSAEVILVKKPSKKPYSSRYQRPAPSYDDGAVE
jgi:hypothetical protein